MQIKSAKELEVYKKAYLLAMDIFQLSKSFPAEERYALVSQIRRSSRSISLNLREAWAKRRYEAHFISKLTDCDGEKLGRNGAVLDSRTAAWSEGLNLRVEQIYQNSETDTSLDFAKDCAYITAEQHRYLTSLCEEIGRMLGSMLRNPAPFLISDL
jgi:hypothetical protein